MQWIILVYLWSHISCHHCLDLSKLSFSSLHRIMIYLQTYPNVPLFYPNKPLTSTSMFKTFTSNSDSKHRLEVPHCLFSHVNSSFSPLADRHSVSCQVETIGMVLIDWNIEKSYMRIFIIRI